ncbi:aspartate aminotransferase [Desulfatibacillum alkenivorans DSM 16219]|jgi:aspartate aminotransferase|uniref:Aminotransferase n=1 Tax=Desulfatibacillum alkenivorans DSM 16219 TaxID=1121393 RepID=A0A1M6PES6_9BACT|nr:pyridoxal phosphate-dependent aminotransferase [Desulfatibacillum alkenivorans]SHK06455.1 aspartate aminotransferase [Desulfatibacillum alkenivorans DSM 16219]
MSISKLIQESVEKSSWIRKMFEEGPKLKAQYGAENVYDFSLGNPNLQPPGEFHKALAKVAADSVEFGHGYTPNSGYPFVRKAVADYINEEQGINATENEVIMTCGAAGALNITLKALLDPGDEVLCPAPYFVEYGFYAQNHGGVLKTAPVKDDFTLDIDAMADAVTEKTKAVLVNSPNNPTGQVYSAESLNALGKLLEDKSKQYGKVIYLLSDEPYRKIAFDGIEVPSIFKCYKETIVATSYSKDLSIPGERIGWACVNPEATYKDQLIGAMTMTNRILGFVNAPGIMQRAVAESIGATVDVSQYAEKRELICNGLEEAGYTFTKPAGAFYLFPKTPTEDDVAFVRALQKERILVVPGRGFGTPGYFRIAFCMDNNTIKNSLPGFAKALKEFK